MKSFEDAQRQLDKWEREEHQYRRWQLAFDLGFAVLALAYLVWWIV